MLNKFGYILFSGIFVLSSLVAYPTVYSFAEQITAHINIINVKDVAPGGTATFTTSQGETFTITFPETQEGTISVQTTTVVDPTSDGSEILFLGEVLLIKIDPPDVCADVCIISFSFDDSHLAEIGTSDPSEVIIFQDSELDGTFVALQTLLTDGIPSPYTVSAFITSNSYFAIGIIDSELFCGKSLLQWEEQGANIMFGTNDNDNLEGIDGIDVIFGMSGNDRIIGNDGDDCLIGGDGDDRIIGEGGNDTIFGEAGMDRLNGGSGDDLIFGGDSDDRITGNRGNDLLDGGNGFDVCVGGPGENLFSNCE